MFKNIWCHFCNKENWKKNSLPLSISCLSLFPSFTSLSSTSFFIPCHSFAPYLPPGPFHPLIIFLCFIPSFHSSHHLPFHPLHSFLHLHPFVFPSFFSKHSLPFLFSCLPIFLPSHHHVPSSFILFLLSFLIYDSFLPSQHFPLSSLVSFPPSSSLLLIPPSSFPPFPYATLAFSIPSSLPPSFPDTLTGWSRGPAHSQLLHMVWWGWKRERGEGGSVREAGRTQHLPLLHVRFQGGVRQG